MQGYRFNFTQPGKTIIEPFSVRKPNSNEIVVKVYRSLISNGTEKSMLRGDETIGTGFPVVPGYSSVGTVIECGSAVKDFKIGDRAFIAKGGHAQYNIRPSSWCAKIPDNVSYEDAVFTRMYRFPLLALRRAMLEIGESVAVVGLGQLGLFAVQLAKLAGGLPVVAVGNREIRRSKALELGADYIFDPNDPDLTQKVKNATAITGFGGADVVIETSGNIDGLAKAMTYTAFKGRIVISGCYWQDSTKSINLLDVNKKGFSLIGAHDQVHSPYNSNPFNWTRYKDFKAILGFMSKGVLTPKVIEPEIHDPSEAPEIYGQLLESRDFPLGVIWDWEHFDVNNN